jgi:hypothetical protein
MSEESEHGDRRSSARGEAAWNEARERVAARNRAARKAGMERREAYERERQRVRREAERERQAGLLAKAPVAVPPESTETR